MTTDEARRVFDEVVNQHYICKDDFSKVEMCIDGLRAYVEVKCKRPLSEAKQRSIAKEFYSRTGMELYYV